MNIHMYKDTIIHINQVSTLFSADWASTTYQNDIIQDAAFLISITATHGGPDLDDLLARNQPMMMATAQARLNHMLIYVWYFVC